MGKYMKKSKISGDVATVVMEVTQHQPPKTTTTTTVNGVCTRAKALALSSFLQLRNRRLLKPTFVEPHKKSQPLRQAVKVDSASKTDGSKRGGVGLVDSEERYKCLKFERRDRNSYSRESTPCSSTSESNTRGSPGLTPGRTSATKANQRGKGATDIRRNFPTTNEMEAFFAYAEQQQQRSFMEKYNFDFAHELPLPGRYEWVQVVLP